MKRTKNGYTLKQYAYATRRLSPKGARSKKELALAVGYSPSVASSVSKHIEKTEGYSNAVAALASETGNIALKIMAEVKHRDLSNIPTERLIDSLETLAHTWATYTPKEKEPSHRDNPLRAIILQHVENREVNQK